MSELDLRVSDARAVPCATIFTDRWGTFGVTGWSSGLCFYLHWMVAGQKYPVWLASGSPCPSTRSLEAGGS